MIIITPTISNMPYNLTKFYQRMWLIAGVIKWTLIRPPGTLVPKAFCFSRDFFFNSPQDLRAPSADRREILPHDQYQRRFYNANPEIRGLSLKNFGEQKPAKFRPILHTFQLWSRISPERHKISKIGKICDLERFLPRSAKQVRRILVHYPESWTCEFGPTQIDFFGRVYFGP